MQGDGLGGTSRLGAAHVGAANVEVGGRACCTVLSHDQSDHLWFQCCCLQDEDFRADFGLPLLTEHDVDCIKSLG